MFQRVRSSKLGQLASIGVLSLSLTACSDDGFGPASSSRTGVFQDSAKVEGLGYRTDSNLGKTDRDGQFSFTAGEVITFSIGELDLPPLQAADTITPLDVFAGNETAVTNLSRLLQSLDVDGMNENGIRLPDNLETIITSNAQIDFGSQDFDAQVQAVLMQVPGFDAMLVDAETATSSLNQTLVDTGVIGDECTANHPYVGRVLQLSSLAHGVSGTVTVLNDCEMEVTEFNYDGGGPSVYFYAGQDRDYVNNAFIIGRRLNGQRWVNDTLRLPLPEGKTFDDFNSLSVWCSDFNANFGEVLFDQ